MVEIVLGSVVFVFGSLGKQNSEVRVEGFGREKLIMPLWYLNEIEVVGRTILIVALVDFLI